MKISSEKFGIVPIELTDKNFNEIAEKLAVSITTKIHEVEQDIKEAKRLTNKADDIDTKKYTVRFWKNNENRDRKTDLIVEATTLQGNAIGVLADLQQEAIKLVTIQYQLSNGLITYFSSALKGELKDANGKIIKLGKNGEEIVKAIIQQAEEYYVEQQKNEKTREVVRQMGNEIAYLNTRMENKDIADNKRDNEFQSFKQAKDNLDDEQDEKIKNNELAIQTLKQEKDNIDQKQDELILKLQKKANIAIAVAIIAILLTIAVLAWSFLK